MPLQGDAVRPVVRRARGGGGGSSQQTEADHHILGTETRRSGKRPGQARLWRCFDNRSHTCAYAGGVCFPSNLSNFSVGAMSGYGIRRFRVDQQPHASWIGGAFNFKSFPSSAVGRHSTVRLHDDMSRELLTIDRRRPSALLLSFPSVSIWQKTSRSYILLAVAVQSSCFTRAFLLLNHFASRS